jgi:hypothetical protein
MANGDDLTPLSSNALALIRGRLTGMGPFGSTMPPQDVQALLRAAAQPAQQPVADPRTYVDPGTGVSIADIGKVGAYGAHVAEPFAYPGEVFQAGMRGNIPRPEEMIPWATSQALGMLGGTPFAEAGAVGAGGGRLGVGRAKPTAPGRAGRGAGIPEAPGAPEAAVSVSVRPLEGLPQEPIDLGEHGTFTPGPHEPARVAAQDYASNAGLDYKPPKIYSQVDPKRAERIAQAFEDMPHDPDNPKVKASYNALINETQAQWDAIKKTGLKVDFIEPGKADPYAKSPRLAQKDVAENNHLWVYPTDSGFGSGPEAAAAVRDNPMLRPAGDINGRPVVANDVFRIVHDYFGHIKEGHGFRATGEENAWRSHAAMYSPEALPAMTAETRGQNSWVNYGPHAQANKTASAADTVYAPQKIGLLPDWAMHEGRLDPVQRGIVTSEGFAVPGKAFDKAAAEAAKQVKALPPGSGPINLTERSGLPLVEQKPLERYVPPRGVSERLTDALNNPDVVNGVHESVQQGMQLGAHKWYHNDPVHQAFRDELGPEEGSKAFRQYINQIGATSPQMKVPANIRTGSFFYQVARNRGELPKPYPFPYGSKGQALHRQNFETLMRGGTGVGAQAAGGFDVLRNPKPPSFVENLMGNLEPGTIDTHAVRNIGMRTGDPRWLEPSVQEKVKPGKALSNFQQRFGEARVNNKGETIVTYRPQQLHKQGRLTMEEAKEIPTFWVSQPSANEYAAIERFYKDVGGRYGLPTADTQAAAWAGGGKLTGLGTPPDKTFAQMLNERILQTALIRGEKPANTLKWMIRAQKPLLTPPGVGLLGQKDQTQ